jgi:predicted N-acyltransferase
MTFELQVAHSVEEIGRAAWDTLAAGRPSANYRWYAFGEQVLDIERAMQLIDNVYRRHNTPVEPWMKRTLLLAHRINATWLTTEIDGQIVGCELLLGDGKTSYLSALGLDYNYRYIYFQLFYEDIRQAIHAGVRQLRAGSTALEVKQRMGFQQLDNAHVLFTATNEWLSKLFGRLAPWFSQHGRVRQPLA